MKMKAMMKAMMSLSDISRRNRVWVLSRFTRPPTLWYRSVYGAKTEVAMPFRALWEGMNEMFP